MRRSAPRVKTRHRTTRQSRHQIVRTGYWRISSSGVRIVMPSAMPGRSASGRKGRDADWVAGRHAVRSLRQARAHRCREPHGIWEQTYRARPLIEAERASCVFDRDFPSRHGAQIGLIAEILEVFSRGGESRVLPAATHRNVQVSSSSFTWIGCPRTRRADRRGSESKKLSRILIFPLAKPIGRLPRMGALIGRISAIGTLRLQSTIVSPFSSRPRYSDRWV